VNGPFKLVNWMGDSLQRVCAFSNDARQDIGFALDRVQRGQEPPDWKPMPSVGPGVMEIRVHAGNEHRLFYVTKFADAIYVLHVFVKKTRKTLTTDIELGRKRYQALLREVHLK